MIYLFHHMQILPKKKKAAKKVTLESSSQDGRVGKLSDFLLL